MEERLADTRHGIRNEFKEAVISLELAHREAQEKASHEHAQVRTDLSQLSVQVATLSTAVTSLAPLVAEVDALKDKDIASSAVNVDRAQRERERRSDRRYLTGLVLGVATLIVTALTVHPFG